MTKREFIRRLHFASFEFREDARKFENFLASLNAEGDSAEALATVIEELKNLEQKWPRVRDFMNWPTFSDWTANGNSNLQPVADLKALLSSLPFHAGKAEGIEFDPVFEAQHIAPSATKSTVERFVGKQLDNFPAEQLWRDPGLAQFEIKLREDSGRRLFSKARIVIPIYPETERGDIDWDYVQELKTLAYGSGYRPTSPPETIIKIFARGEISKHRKGDDTLRSIAKNLGVNTSTAYEIYEKAHKFVYGHPPKKRRYRTAEEITVPDTPEEIPENPGPSLDAKLTKKGDIQAYEKYRYSKKEDGVIREFSSIFDEIEDAIREECSRCRKFVDNSEGEYSPDPERFLNEIFTCRPCLDRIL